ncbi:MAG: HAMP domain-containing sensor histidine kinase, partial [Candidatus Paceibacterota bacterium]
QELERELNQCLGYLELSPKDRSNVSNPKCLLIHLFNKLAIYIDSEIEKGSVTQKNLDQQKERIKTGFSSLVVLTKEENGKLQILDLSGSMFQNEINPKWILEELQVLSNSTNQNQCYLLDTHLYSYFHQYKINLILKVDNRLSTNLSGDEQLKLWFCFSKTDSFSTQTLCHAKSLARQLFVQYTQREQIQGLTDKIVKSRQDNISKGRLFSGISHDLRSPINNLQAINTCLRDNFLVGSEEHELLAMAAANIRMLNELIDDLISLTKYRSGNLQSKLEVVKVSDLLKEIHQLYQFDAKLKSLELKVEYPVLEDRILVDSLQLKRILGNLLSNALKYTQTGGVTLLCKQTLNSYQFWIIDTGVGLSSEQIKRICRPFVRFSDHEIEGVGLGLAITKLLIELHAGKLEISSEAGKGSEF